MAIGKICNRKLVVAYPDSTVTEAASLMRKHHAGSVIVVDHRGEGARPIGIITDSDLVRFGSQGSAFDRPRPRAIGAAK